MRVDAILRKLIERRQRCRGELYNSNKCLSLLCSTAKTKHMNKKGSKRRAKNVPSEAVQVQVVISQPNDVYRRSAIPCSTASTAANATSARIPSRVAHPKPRVPIPIIEPGVGRGATVLGTLAVSRTNCSVEAISRRAMAWTRIRYQNGRLCEALLINCRSHGQMGH